MQIWPGKPYPLGATFDGAGTLWFTGQSGVYGRLDPASGVVEVFDAPGGPGPYGIATATSMAKARAKMKPP